MEPTEGQINAYAVFLGMNLEEDQEFMYLAKEGLSADVQEPWDTLYDDNENIYYLNKKTGVTQEDHPMDEVYRSKLRILKAER